MGEDFCIVETRYYARHSDEHNNTSSFYDATSQIEPNRIGFPGRIPKSESGIRNDLASGTRRINLRLGPGARSPNSRVTIAGGYARGFDVAQLATPAEPTRINAPG